MTESTEDAQTQRWHRKFAVTCNNRAWKLSVQARTALQDRELLDAAHTAAWHWERIGTELHRMRATTLLAEVHALLGMGPSALQFAETVSVFFLGRATEDWELALVHAVHAHAAHAAGRGAERREFYARAAAALAVIAHEEDRKIVSDTFHLVPPP